jgi:FMN phosphatase YigB (HAD superfamily)
VIRPIVAIDIDGTLGDYHGHFERFARQWLGRQPEEDAKTYDGRIKYREWFAQAYHSTVDEFRTIKLAYRQGGLKRSMPLADRAAPAVLANLRKRGIEVWLVTTRPYLKLDGIDPDTRFWLAHHGVGYDHLLYGPNKYERLAEQVDPGRIIACVDDDMNHLVEAMNFNWTAILIRTKYNRGVRFDYTAQNLCHAQQLITMELSSWNNHLKPLPQETT